MNNFQNENANDNFYLQENINKANIIINSLLDEVKKVIIWQDDLIKSLIICLLTKNHILIEWVPWLAKTKTINTFSHAINLAFKRVQFTPDLLPSDLVWTEIYNFKNSTFDIVKGPIFTNFLLADEINRSPSKVQSALLEAMAESQVTIWWKTFNLDKPFMVLATQNPIENSWTYNLPEAQLDRFLMKVKVDYVSKENEILMYKNSLNQNDVKNVINIEDIFFLQNLLNDIYVSEKIYDYVYSIVDATRNPDLYWLNDLKNYIEFWVWPRWALWLIQSWTVSAILNNRSFLIPEDIIDNVYNVLGHRIILSYEAIADNINSKDVLSKIISNIKIV